MYAVNAGDSLHLTPRGLFFNFIYIIAAFDFGIFGFLQSLNANTHPVN